MVSFALPEPLHQDLIHLIVGKLRLGVTSGTVSKAGLSEEKVCVSKSRWGGAEAGGPSCGLGSRLAQDLSRTQPGPQCELTKGFGQVYDWVRMRPH